LIAIHIRILRAFVKSNHPRKFGFRIGIFRLSFGFSVGHETLFAAQKWRIPRPAIRAIAIPPAVRSFATAKGIYSASY
jgi:hypothetical protein